MHEFIYVHVVRILNVIVVCEIGAERERERERERPEERPPLVTLARGWIPDDVKQCSNGSVSPPSVLWSFRPLLLPSSRSPPFLFLYAPSPCRFMLSQNQPTHHAHTKIWKAAGKWEHWSCQTLTQIKLWFQQYKTDTAWKLQLSCQTVVLRA